MNNLQSLGHAAGIFQQDPRTIQAALVCVQAEKAEKAGQPISGEAKPALSLNGVAYFDADEIIDAIAWLAKRDAQKKRAEASAND
jgi:hypothetical protein